MSKNIKKENEKKLKLYLLNQEKLKVKNDVKSSSSKDREFSIKS